MPNSNITINNKKYNSTGYSLTLTPENIQTILINFITKMQEDTSTMTIIQNILARIGLDVQSQFTEENINNFLTELLNKLQQENPINFNITIRVVLTIDDDNISNIIIDNVLTKKDNIKYIFYIVTGDITNVEDISTALQSGELNGIQLEIEKTASNSEISHNEVLKMQINGELNSFSAQTVLERVKDNSIYNTSNITIEDSHNNIVNISYDKTINATTEHMDIMELKDSNAVIINNYPLEQLEVFFENLLEKYTEVFEPIFERLQLNFYGENAEINGIRCIEVISFSTLCIANTNGFQRGDIVLPIASTTFYITFSEGGILDIFSENERNSTVYEYEGEQLKSYYFERLSNIEARLKTEMMLSENNEQYLEKFKNYIELDTTFNGSEVINENNNKLRLKTKEGYIFEITSDSIYELFELNSKFTN